MFGRIFKKDFVLRALLDDLELCRVTLAELPTEQRISRPARRGSAFVMVDAAGRTYRHDLAFEEGW